MPPALAQQRGPTVAGQQEITVQIEGMPRESEIFVERVGTETLELLDEGRPVRRATFYGTPARTIHLRVDERTAGNDQQLWKGMVLLADHSKELIAFTYTSQQGHTELVRVALSPTLPIVIRRDPGAPFVLSIGWGLLALVYLGFLVMGWTRSRSGSEPA